MQSGGEQPISAEAGVAMTPGAAPVAMPFYDALELQPHLSVDAADLQQRFYARSRQWHPDRYTRASAEDQQKSLDMTALLNDAFRTLRDPITRAEYFLKQHQIELGKEVPPELLEEVFELNMALDELRGGDESVRSQLTEAGTRFTGMRQELDVFLNALAVKYDDHPTQAVLEEVRAALNRRRYISNLIHSVEAELKPKA